MTRNRLAKSMLLAVAKKLKIRPSNLWLLVNRMRRSTQPSLSAGVLGYSETSSYGELTYAGNSQVLRWLWPGRVASTPSPKGSYNLAGLMDGLEVRQSVEVPGTLGLFATRHFLKGQFITEYTGPMISEAEVKGRKEKNIQTKYLCSMRGFGAIDGDPYPLIGAGVAQFTNSPNIGRGNALFNHDTFMR